MTLIRDTVYKSDGSLASGSVVITWPPFISADNKPVFGGSKTIPLNNGNLSVSLVPTSGATPSGVTYDVKYFQSGGVSYQETWVVPSSSGSVSLSQVRTAAAPSSNTVFNAAQVNGTAVLEFPTITQTIISPASAGVVPLRLKGNPTANANLLEIYDSQATPVLQGRFDSIGALRLSQTPMFSTMTQGSLLFAGSGGLLSQENVNLFWGPSSSRSGTSAQDALQIGPVTGFTGLQGIYIGSGSAGHHTVSCLNTGDRQCAEFVMEDNTAHNSWAILSGIDATNTSGTAFATTAIAGDAYREGAGTSTFLQGIASYVENDAGTTVNMTGFHATSNVKGGGTVTNNYGLLIDDQAVVGANNFAIKTGTGKVAFGDAVTAPVIESVRYADQFTGADWCAKVTAADADLGGGTGEIWINSNAGTSACAAALSVTHTLRFMDGAVYTMPSSSPEITTTKSILGTGATLKVPNGANPQQSIQIPHTAVGWKIEGMTFDGNRANNPGPFLTDNSFIWVGGDGAGTGQDTKGIITHNIFNNCILSCIRTTLVAHVEVSHNRATNTGQIFLIVDSSAVDGHANDNLVADNDIEFSKAASVFTVVATNGSTAITSAAAFDTHWGASGYFTSLQVAGIANYVISSCATTSACTLTAPFTQASGSYTAEVGGYYGIWMFGSSNNRITGNRLTGPDGASEAININSGSNNLIDSNIVSYPAPHTVGAEGITISNQSDGTGNCDENTVSNNTVSNSYSVGFLLNPFEWVGPTGVAGHCNGNKYIGNTVIDAYAGNVNPGESWDAGIRVAGTKVDNTLVDDTQCISTRTGLTNHRNGWNYCVVLDNVGVSSTNGTIGLTKFEAADTTAPLEVYRDGATNTTIATFNRAGTYTIGKSLVLQGASDATVFDGTNPATYGHSIQIKNPSAVGAGVHSFLQFDTGSATVDSFFGIAQNASNYGDFVFAGYSGSYAEWMRIKAGGVVNLPILSASSLVQTDASKNLVSSNTLPSGTILPNPSSSTLGGIKSLAAVSHQWINTISTSGVPSATQPAVADLSDSKTGSGNLVLATSPTIYTPNISGALGGNLDLGTNGQLLEVANDTSTGTTVKLLATLSAGKAIKAATTDAKSYALLGIVVAGAGTSGNAQIASSGTVTCTFDGAATQGNWAVLSTGTAGDCHDGGSSLPADGTLELGVIAATIGGAGDTTVYVFSPQALLTNTVSASTQTKITYNAMGQVTSGAQAQFSDIGGSVAASQLPNPSASTLGGTESFAAVTNSWINAISTSGVPSATQPAFSNLSGSATCAQLPALTGHVTTSAGSCATTAAGISTAFTAFCTGASITSSSTVFMPGFGGVLTTCTGMGTTRTSGMPVSAGTIKNLRVNMGTGGKASDKVTVEIAGVASALTCTYGTATSCSDTTHTAAVTAGQVLTIAVVTGASDTTANLAVYFELVN